MSGLYIHIPFCERRCNYCDFYFETKTNKYQLFIDALCKEIAFKKTYQLEPVKSIYFGGGTPSILEVTDIEKILNECYKYYPLLHPLEITIEANPEHITKDYLNKLKFIGVNRISLGIQSFQERKLQRLSRNHTSTDSIEKINLCKEYFENVSIDLIFGESNETIYEWKSDLQMAMTLSHSHISIYGLTIEPNTLLSRMVSRGARNKIDESLHSEMFFYTMDELEKHQYIHYEVSNFAKNGFQSVHNSMYWKRKPYLGFGPSAHSFCDEVRFANINSVSSYIANPTNSVDTMEYLDKKNIANEFVMLNLRQGSLNISEYYSFVSQKEIAEKKKIIQKFANENFVNIENDFLFLTKKGFVFIDHIILQLL